MTIAVDGDDKHQTKQTNADIYYAHQRETTEITEISLIMSLFKMGTALKGTTSLPLLKDGSKLFPLRVVSYGKVKHYFNIR